MSAFEYREYTLLCDHQAGEEDRCAAAFGPFGVERSRAALRKLAARDGWTHVREPAGPRYDKDFCPEHKGDAR